MSGRKERKAKCGDRSRPGGLGGRSGTGTRSSRRQCQSDGCLWPGRVRIKAVSGLFARGKGP
jgi:hypothetical protein